MLSSVKVTQADIYMMIARSIISVDLDAAPIADPEDVLVFAERETMIAFHASKATEPMERGIMEFVPGKALDWDGVVWTVLNLGENLVTLQGKDGQLAELSHQTIEKLIQDGKLGRMQGDSQTQMPDEAKHRINAARPEEILRANRLEPLIHAYLYQRADAPPDIPDRTWRQLVADYVAAEQELGHGYVGILRQTQMRGNHQPWNALPEETRKETIAHIRDHYGDIRQKGMCHCWSDFKLSLQEHFAKECEGMTTEEKKALPPPRIPSLQTYSALAKNLDPIEMTRRRRGPKAAYQEQPWYWSLVPQTPRHGDRAWEIGHIDHTKCDVMLRPEDRGDDTRRPWWTTLTDAFTRRILAQYLTWDPPSYKSCMIVIRECVRRFRRLPQIIIVDHGKEFESEYFDQLLAMYGVTKKIRPKSEPRSGSTSERTFGTANTEFFHNLLGNTQATKDVRSMSASHDPRKLSEWTLLRLAERLEEYSYEIYDTLEHPALGQSPRNAFKQSVASAGERRFRRIVYDQDFIMLTFPTTKKKTAMVLERGLINVNYILYWNEMLLSPKLRGKQLHVRYDPFDAGVAWVYANKIWIRCHSAHYAELRGKSEKLIEIITRRIRERNERYPQLRLTVNAVTLARFLRELRKDEEILRQERLDRESQAVRDRQFKSGPALCVEPTSDKPQLVESVVDASAPKAPHGEVCQPETIPRKRMKILACKAYDAKLI